MNHPSISSLRRRSLMKMGLGGGASLAAALGAGSLGNLLGVRPARAADYKALVCIFLYGGNDGLNMIVPNDAARHNQYAGVRGSIAIPRASLLPLDGVSYGLHPAMTALGGVWDEGRLAPVFNVGPLVRPTTKAQYLAAVAGAGPDAGSLPDRLFSHADQQTLWDTAGTNSLARAGWGGRASETLVTTHPVISVAGTSRFGSSSLRAPLVLPGPGTEFVARGLGAADTRPPQVARREAIDALFTQPQERVLAEVYSATQREALAVSTRLSALVKTVPGDPGAIPAIDTAFAPIIAGGQIGTGLGKQLYQLAKLIADNATVQGTRQIFFASMGSSFDTHRGQLIGNPLGGSHAPLLKELADALAAFHAALKALGLGSAVTSFTQSEFGRTLAPNQTSGTDHGWGNQQLVMGGAVQGGKTFGAYPELVLGGADDVGQDSRDGLGRWIPTTAVEQYAATMLHWFGATDTQLDTVLPNLRNFGANRTLGFL